MPEIRECPCCGGRGELKDMGQPYRHGWVGCRACGLYIQWKVSPAGAVKKWNRRSGGRTAGGASSAPTGGRTVPAS